MMKKWIKYVPIIVLVILLILYFVVKLFDLDDNELVEDVLNIDDMMLVEEEISEEDKEIMDFSEKVIEANIETKFDKSSIKEDDIASGNYFEGILEQEPVLFEPDIPSDWKTSMTDNIEGYFTMNNHERIKELEQVYDTWKLKNNIPEEIQKEIEILNTKLNILSKKNDFHNYVYYFTDEFRKMLGSVYANLVNDENMYDEYVLTYIEHYDKKKEMAIALNFKESIWKEEEKKITRDIHHFITIYKKEEDEWKIYYEIPFLSGEQQEVYKIFGNN